MFFEKSRSDYHPPKKAKKSIKLLETLGRIGSVRLLFPLNGASRKWWSTWKLDQCIKGVTHMKHPQFANELNSAHSARTVRATVRSELNRNLGGFWTMFCLLIRGRLKFHLRESWGPADGWMKRSFHAAAFKGISSQRAQNLVFTVWAFETVQH